MFVLRKFSIVYTQNRCGARQRDDSRSRRLPKHRSKKRPRSNEAVHKPIHSGSACAQAVTFRPASKRRPTCWYTDNSATTLFANVTPGCSSRAACLASPCNIYMYAGSRWARYFLRRGNRGPTLTAHEALEGTVYSRGSRCSTVCAFPSLCV